MEDCEIVELYFARSEEAIQKTKQKYGAFCFHIANNILNSKEDAEECELDSYLRVWNAVPPKKPIPLKSYLAKIVRNLALQRYEYYSAKKRNTELEVAFCELEECIPDASNVEGQLNQQELSKAMNDFLLKIDRGQRILFVRRYWYTDSIKDIASRFGISESKVKSSLFRTRNRLRTYLKKEGFLL